MGQDENESKPIILMLILQLVRWQKVLKSRRLMLMTDVEGVYDKSKKLISEIKSNDAEKLIYDETISEGMIPKIRTCIDAVNNGVKRCGNYRWQKTSFYSL